MRRTWAGVLVCGALACAGRPHPATGDRKGGLPVTLGKSEGQVVELDLTAGVPESTGGSVMFPLTARRTYAGLIRTLGDALGDQRVTGIYVGLGGNELGWARTEELGQLLGRIRARGKPVVCHAHNLSNASAWLVGAGCDRVWLSPAGSVDAVGIAAEVLYFRNALDKLKIRADFLSIGKYKSAAEGFTREGPSDEARESLTETLASIRSSWLDGMQAARRAPTVRDALEHGPWSPEEAKAQGLVDAVGYESEARADAEQRGQASKTTPRFGPHATGDKFDLTEVVRLLSGADDRSSGRPHVALVPAEGAINLRASGTFGGGGILAEPLIKTLRKLKTDDSVKAVVLRIDSPGGSALASDLIWHELMQLRQKKPLVASVGDMAASGGYYLACAAQRVVAERTSIVGSIGVLGGKLVVDQSLAALGVNAVVFPASPDPDAVNRAGYESLVVPWDDAVRERVRSSMQAVYDLFIRRVAEGRGRPAAEIRPVAEGRIWSGVQGKERGLVDELGGLGRALELGRELGGLDANAPVTVEGPGTSLFETLLLDDDASAQAIAQAIRELKPPVAGLVDALPARLRPFASSLTPLVGGEHTLVALPFALVVE
jgi:protease-4